MTLSCGQFSKMSGFIPAHSLDKFLLSAIGVAFFAAIVTPIVLVFMLLLRKSPLASSAESDFLDTASLQRPLPAKRSKAFWKKTLRRDRRRALKAQDIHERLIYEEQDQKEFAADVENAGFPCGANSPDLDDCHILEIPFESMNGCINVEAEGLCGHGSQDDQPDQVQSHDLCVTGGDVISFAGRPVPDFDIASKNMAIHSNKFVCMCSESRSWGCVQHRTYAKELLLAHRLRSALPRDAGVCADGSSFFVLLAEPPGLERLTKTR